jgi:hypothetical protein
MTNVATTVPAFQKWQAAHPGTDIQGWLHWKFAHETEQEVWAWQSSITPAFLPPRRLHQYGYVFH